MPVKTDGLLVNGCIAYDNKVPHACSYSVTVLQLEGLSLPPLLRPTPQLNITVFLLDKTVELHELGAHCCAVGSTPTVCRRPLCRLRIKSLSSITSGPRGELQVKAWELCPPSLNIAVGQLNSWYKALGGTWMKVKPASPRAPISLLYLLFRVK